MVGCAVYESQDASSRQRVEITHHRQLFRKGKVGAFLLSWRHRRAPPPLQRFARPPRSRELSKPDKLSSVDDRTEFASFGD